MLDVNYFIKQKNNFLSGIGLSLQQPLLIQVLKQHFTKNFASANGVLNTGACVGNFVLIPVFKIILDMYGVSGALLITSGIMLHVVPVAMLLRDPKYRMTATALPDRESNAKEQRVFIETVSKQSSSCIRFTPIQKPLTNNPVIKDSCVEATNYVTSTVDIKKRK